ncbi:hypothetical protein Hypma_002001 [Hypsizygus marmoreus]|uniref:F-box domain-containing protein n=1 Tax=Hypsizygus marmoreus TaxID=39966 RepID=A0A369J9T3_HYPMA|nr:hypothetical protein Hypma_002001 [Hypsizygus marmoreus]
MSVGLQPDDPTNLIVSSPPPSVLPQELLDKIIDNLHHDFESLKQCSLASSLLKLRSHKYLYSSIRISDMYRIQRLRGLVDANSTLLENVRELELADFWAWVAGDRHLPVILRMATSLRSLSILNARCSWWSIHRDTRDALIQVFRSPSLATLCIDTIYSFPIPIFSLDINVTHLTLKEITVDAFTFPSATLADYSRMNVHTLEIFSTIWSLVQAVIDLPNSFITRIHRLIIHNATSLAHDRIMTTARNSLESILIYDLETISLENWVPYDFTLLPKLKHIELYLALRFGEPSDFKLRATTALARIVDFSTMNPTAARIESLSICFICRSELYFILQWRTFMDNLAAISQWEELDRILDAARGSVSSSPKHIISLDLQLIRLDNQRYLYVPSDDFLWRQSVDQMKTFWRDKVHDIMPLASHRGLLVTGDIVYTDI